MPRKATKEEQEKFKRFFKWIKKEKIHDKVKGNCVLLSLSMKAFEQFEENKNI